MMTKRHCRFRPSLLAVLLSFGVIGCVNPPFQPWVPIPIQPWVAERMSDKYCHPNDFRTPVLPPVRDGFPAPICEDPPAEREVLRAMPRISRGVPYFYEEHRDNIEIIPEKLVDKIDPPRFFPLVGPAQLHHCHWKCTIYYKETVISSYPFPCRCVKNRVQVIYIDKDHLHLWVGPKPEAQDEVAKDLIGY
jgi:hypothetical protein